MQIPTSPIYTAFQMQILKVLLRNSYVYPQTLFSAPWTLQTQTQMEPPLFFRTAVCFEEEGTSWGCQSILAFFPHLVFWCLLSNIFDRPPRILFDGESAVFSFLVFSLSVFSAFFFPLWPACELFRAEAWGTISICPCFLSSSQMSSKCFNTFLLSSRHWNQRVFI